MELKQDAWNTLRSAIQKGIDSGTIENFDIESTIQKAKSQANRRLSLNDRLAATPEGLHRIEHW